ncbi:MAG: N-acetylmuramic acid 6-phosphate etherase [Planctomycetaceae bacterium]
MYGDLPTEGIDPHGPDLDLLSPREVARLLLEEERRAVRAVEEALEGVGRACEAAAWALRGGGRLFYAGAGTSGRLGVLDASEMGPTFGTPPGRVVALLAGAPRALTESVEGAEDDADSGRAAMEEQRPGTRDCVLGITMSGTAAFVEGALAAAREAGARTLLLTANARASMAADLTIALDLGPEALAGSTRLKGGSATKAVLNMISTAAMAASGAVYGNLMVRLRPVNRKLRDRAERIVERLGGVGRQAAAALLREAGDEAEVAVVMARLGLDPAAARAKLAACGGRLREVIA